MNMDDESAEDTETSDISRLQMIASSRQQVHKEDQSGERVNISQSRQTGEILQSQQTYHIQ